jgi:ABC-type Fe3+-siderophore transport system permease subunit
MKPTLFFPCALISLVGLVLLSLCVGAVTLTPQEVWHGLEIDNTHYFTVHEYRLPRVVIACLVGAVLGLSGALVQGIIRNPLASPDILGVSQGAGCAAVIFLSLWPTASILWLPYVATLGGLSAAVVLWFLAGRHSGALRLAMTGVAVSVFFTSITDFVLLVFPMEINNATLWLTGSLWGRNWSHLHLLLPLLILVPFTLLLAKPFNLLSLGDASAKTLGVPIHRVRAIGLGLAIIMTSVSVAVCGPLSFIGFIAPHLARHLVGQSHLKSIPAAMCLGAILLVIADGLARAIAPPLELPTGLLTAILGAPYFLWLMIRIK